MVQELISSLQLIEQIITIFGFKARWILDWIIEKPKLSTRQEAIGWLKQAYRECRLSLVLSDELPRRGAMKSLRIELRISDALGREWAVSASVDCLLRFHKA